MNPSENSQPPVAVSRDSGEEPAVRRWHQATMPESIYETAYSFMERHPEGEWVAYEDYKTLVSTLTRLREEHAALLKVAGRALRETRVEEIGDWDGGDLQDAMTESGLLEIQNPVVPCGESCRCAEFYEAGNIAVCYVFTDLAQRALQSLENSDPRSA